MRLSNPTIPLCHLANAIENDLAQRKDTQLHKPHIQALADIVASAINTKSVNTCVWKHSLPRQDCSDHAREKFIHRTLSNPLIQPERVMLSYGAELITNLCKQDETAVLMLDQSKLVDGFECLMLSIRVGERALPWLWVVKATGGGIGFEEQQSLLTLASQYVPTGVSVMLLGDRFYGTSALISWCQQQNWQYRLRLRRNLHLEHEGGLLISGELLAQGLPYVEGCRLGGVTTCVGVVHDEGHDEPWIIAMDCKPNRARVLDYGLRWGIESLFSDLKSRGFDIESSHLRHADRLSRLLLVVSIASYWCVSLGAESEEKGIPPKKEVCVLGLPKAFGGYNKG
jgi:hypothetical protein